MKDKRRVATRWQAHLPGQSSFLVPGDPRAALTSSENAKEARSEPRTSCSPPRGGYALRAAGAIERGVVDRRVREVERALTGAAIVRVALALGAGERELDLAGAAEVQRRALGDIEHELAAGRGERRAERAVAGALALADLVERRAAGVAHA